MSAVFSGYMNYCLIRKINITENALVGNDKEDRNLAFPSPLLSMRLSRSNRGTSSQSRTRTERDLVEGRQQIARMKEV